MSTETRTERRRTRHQRNLVVGSVIALAAVLSLGLLGLLLTGGGGARPSADSPLETTTSDWTPTGDDVWESASVSPTPVPTSTSTAPSLTETGTPAPTTTAAPTGGAVTVARTTDASRAPAPAAPRPTATPSSETEPPGLLKRPKPKNTPPPRR